MRSVPHWRNTKAVRRSSLTTSRQHRIYYETSRREMPGIAQQYQAMPFTSTVDDDHQCHKKARSSTLNSTTARAEHGYEAAAIPDMHASVSVSQQTWHALLLLVADLRLERARWPSSSLRVRSTRFPSDTSACRRSKVLNYVCILANSDQGRHSQP